MKKTHAKLLQSIRDAWWTADTDVAELLSEYYAAHALVLSERLGRMAYDLIDAQRRARRERDDELRSRRGRANVR